MSNHKEENPIRVTGPDGTERQGFKVDIEEATERFNRIVLSDSTVLRIKISALSATRLKDSFDPDGNPVYIVATQNTILVDSAPDELKKRG